MYIRYAGGLGRAAAATTISSTDSRLVKQVTPAALSGVQHSGHNLNVHGLPNIIHELSIP